MTCGNSEGEGNLGLDWSGCPVSHSLMWYIIHTKVVRDKTCNDMFHSIQHGENVSFAKL